MSYAGYTPEEVERRGEELYQREIRPKVEPGNKGRVVVMDIESGDFEVYDDDLHATKRLLARRPNGVLYGLRIGYPAVYTMGGHFEEEP